MGQTHDKMKIGMNEALAKTTQFTLVQDGWSRVTSSPDSDHTIHATGGEAFFLNSKWMDMPKDCR